MRKIGPRAMVSTTFLIPRDDLRTVTRIAKERNMTKSVVFRTLLVFALTEPSMAGFINPRTHRENAK